MWVDSWGHSDSSPKGSLWSVTGNSPTPSSIYIQQSDPMLQNRARRHHNGSCGCWFQFSSLQVTNMCLCRSVNEAKQQSDEGKLVESFWVFCWQRNVQFYIKRCDRRFSPSNSRKLMMWRCTHVNQSHDSAVHHSRKCPALMLHMNMERKSHLKGQFTQTRLLTLVKVTAAAKLTVLA